LGRGFSLPNDARRLALAAFETGLSRLLPLAKQAMQQECAVTVFADPPLPDLPPAIEVYPLEDLPEALAWADLMALDLRREFLPRLRDALDIRRGASLACPIEALIWTPMPCGGLGRCGACHMTAPGGWKLACEDGPVFDIQHLDW
jgi:dihydroorotate dehydrogenase electron transfer subunit